MCGVGASKMRTTSDREIRLVSFTLGRGGSKVGF